MEAMNPFSDPSFKKAILEREGLAGGDDIDAYEEIPEEDEALDMKAIITSAPKIPVSGNVKNLIVDATALAKNEKEAKAQEVRTALNQVFSDYNKTYGLNLNLDLGNLSNTLVAVSDPKKRHILELYLSETFKSIRPIIIVHLLNRLMLAIDYITAPERMFGSDMSVQDIFLVVDKLYGYIQQLEELKDEVTVVGSDIELRKLSDEAENIDFSDEESKKVVNDFLGLLRKDKGIG